MSLFKNVNAQNDFQKSLKEASCYKDMQGKNTNKM